MSIETETEEDGGSGFLAAVPSILWQRRWLILAPAVLATIGGATAAFLIHPVYESSATVLIESQQLPDALLGDLGSSQAGDAIGQRVARARERVLSRMDLIRLIRTYNLYPDEQRTVPLSKIVDEMRASTNITALNNELVNAKSRRNLGLANTIAINVSFRYDDPQKAQVVAQQFVDRFLEADATSQATQATDAVNFLTEQANTVQSQIAEIEAKSMQIKAENGTVLALGQATGNQSADLSRIDAQIAGLQAENLRLNASGGASQETGVAAAEAQLRVAQAKFSDTHPDVVAARAQVEAARRAAAALPASANPVAAQIASNRAQIASLQRAQGMLASQSSAVVSAQSRAPVLAGQVDQLEKRADALREQYRTIGAKLQAAQIQARVESEQKGERLTLADPPVVPDSPVRPNRPMIILGSILGGLALGLGLALLIELILRPIRGTQAMRQALGQPPLAVIPDFDSKPNWIVRLLERRTRRKTARA
ncbi:Wzz/FepE/Etk N-terminal domain-containing protein [uncultured Sphingomonas sp.]|uniref:GumC family protein n=1 Tax=uncultured Sphingomonas sp. TaxID=158754 RepID=UPI0025F4A198|nr:Wzz/FepE/Etk N-terminal domain-containing protein [uncultured Sphingomonas sp.]